MKDEPMYIEVKHYDTIIRIEQPGSDQSLEEMIEIIANLLRAMGYGSEQISERLDVE